MKKMSGPAAWLVMAAAAVFLLTPLVVLGIYSFSVEWSGLLPGGFTGDYYRQVFSQGQLWPAVFRGLLISVVPILLSGGLVLLALYVSVFYAPGLEPILQSVCMIPHTLKGVVLAISVLSLYAGSGPVLGNRIVLLTCVYSIIILPYVYQGIRNNLRAIPIRQMVEAAQLLGAGRLQAFMSVVIPNILNGILSSALLGMSVIFGDFAVVKIIAGSQYITVQQMLYNARNQAGQFSSVIVLITFAVTLIISRTALEVQKRDKRRDSKCHT